MKKRSVVSVVVLSIITCGIYMLYWFYVMTEDMNAKDSTKPQLTNFVVALLLGIVTCSIYLIYWMYRFFEKSDAVTKKNNLIIYFILSLICFEIVSVALLQNDVNNME